MGKAKRLQWSWLIYPQSSLTWFSTKILMPLNSAQRMSHHGESVYLFSGTPWCLPRNESLSGSADTFMCSRVTVPIFFPSSISLPPDAWAWWETKREATESTKRTFMDKNRGYFTSDSYNCRKENTFYVLIHLRCLNLNWWLYSFKVLHPCLEAPSHQDKKDVSITVLYTHHTRKDSAKSLNSCYRFGFPSSETVLKLVEWLANWVGVWNLCIVYECDVSDSPSLINTKQKLIYY